MKIKKRNFIDHDRGDDLNLNCSWDDFVASIKTQNE